MKTAKVAMLALVGITFLMAGCARHHGMMGDGHREAALERGITEMSDLVDQTVKDPEKAKQVKGILQEIVAEAKQSYKQNRDFHSQLYALNANYNATPEQFTKVLDDLNNARMKTASKILGLRFKIKDLLTAQEWTDLTGGMEKARMRYQPKPEGM